MVRVEKMDAESRFLGFARNDKIAGGFGLARKDNLKCSG